jgi:hypothetical protein
MLYMERGEEGKIKKHVFFIKFQSRITFIKISDGGNQKTKKIIHG